MPEGAESPPPERQTGAQMNDPLASGHGTDSAEGKDKKLDKEIKGLQSNPKGPMDKSLESKFSKKPGNCELRRRPTLRALANILITEAPRHNSRRHRVP
ncbi:hypothetical protein OCS_03415 [Ophiocordyceps sinensis CO18]|uniref:Uncharacterized protein n=1 Tax=Ophiocordyceps sinensis (strain Co18 / CGMCC 3.14243) TaxID=911162 RepID=T5AGC0_OPHSC|nr:hypothetical protein OCS_03415 [Ophiocordyceps sinensis CO18]